MIWSLLAIGLALLILAAFCAWAYVTVEPIYPAPGELTDEQVAENICGTGTKGPRRGV